MLTELRDSDDMRTPPSDDYSDSNGRAGTGPGGTRPAPPAQVSIIKLCKTYVTFMID
jgi:hypothetical protein